MLKAEVALIDMVFSLVMKMLFHYLEYFFCKFLSSNR